MLALRHSRKRARESVETQAVQMLKRSKRTLAPAEYGDNIALPVPAVDRGKCNPKNMLGVIIAKTAENNYKIGVKSGIVKGTYSRNSLALCARKYIISFVSGLREGTKFLLSGGQGFFHSQCKKLGKQ